MELAFSPYILFGVLAGCALLGWLVATLTAKRFTADWAEIATDTEKASGQPGRTFRLRIGIYAASAAIWSAAAVAAFLRGDMSFLIFLYGVNAALMTAMVVMVYRVEKASIELDRSLNQLRKRWKI